MDGKLRKQTDWLRRAGWIAASLSSLITIEASVSLADFPLAADIRPLADVAGSRPIELASESNAQSPGLPETSPVLLRGSARVISAENTGAVATLSQPERSGASPSPSNSTREAESDEQRTMTVEEALKTRGSVTFRKTPLSDVIFMLSDLWKINIVAGDSVSGEVSGAFHDAPLSEVLSAALTSSGYSYRKTGSSLVVLSADQVGSDDPSFRSATLRLPSVLRDDGSALEAAGMLLSDRGQMRRIGIDSVLVIDSESRIDRVRRLFAGFGGADEGAFGSGTDPTSEEETLTSAAAAASSRAGIAYFSPQFTEAEEMAEPLQTALGDQVIVAVFPEENRIMIKGSRQDLAIAAEAIEQLDRARPQVRITAMIYDVSLKEIERLGVNWSAQPHSNSLGLVDINEPDVFQFRNLVGASTSLVTDPTATGAGNLTISTLNQNFNLDMLLQALNSSSEAKLLADPSITVGDRRQASIRIVQKIPILAADPVENSGVVFSQVQFEEAGVILNVLPRISRDGTIDMKVEPEYSVVSDFIANNPVIDTRIAETTVRVTDGQMFALGGLRQKSIVESVRGVPFLKDVKYIGKLFRSHDTEIRESELIVFLKPELITPCDRGNPRQREAAWVTEQQLGEIPHAQICPMTPCCKDPNCPNHHPRTRVNGGSEALRYSDMESEHEVISDSAIPTTQVPAHEVIIENDVMENSGFDNNAIENSMMETVPSDYPAVHIDPSFMP